MRLMLCAIMLLLVLPSEGRLIRVDDDGDADFASIQAALAMAEDGDVIEVLSGVYAESVNITKSISVRGIDSGEDLPLLNGGGRDGFVVSSNGVNVSGFIITNASGWGAAGIRVLSEDALISGCNVSDSFTGVLLLGGNGSAVDNNITGCHFAGIVAASSYNALRMNRVHENNNAGILILSSSGNLVDGNDASYNLGSGIKAYRSSDCVIRNNTAYTNDYGIVLSESHGCAVDGNILEDNDYGIYPYLSSRNTISRNTARTNDYAVYLYSSWNNSITENDLRMNDAYGILIYYSDNNTISSNDLRSNEIGGVSVRGSRNNTISGNDMGGSPHSLHMEDSEHNIAEGNRISGGETGVVLERSMNNTLAGNTISDMLIGMSISSGRG
ncbi:MAG: NosD domain-containing protein, partial [Methanothrix sp.]